MNAKLDKEKLYELYNDLNRKCEDEINKKWELIKKEHPNITKNDALIIAAYTYEPKGKFENYSPYRLLNTSLVTTNGKNGVQNIEKYLLIFLCALRKLKL